MNGTIPTLDACDSTIPILEVSDSTIPTLEVSDSTVPTLEAATTSRWQLKPQESREYLKAALQFCCVDPLERVKEKDRYLRFILHREQTLL